LNDDVEIKDASKLDLPFKHFSNSRVGAAGINLFFANESFQHSGIEYRSGEPQHFLKGSHKDYLKPWTSFCREVSGVTGAVLYLKKDIFMNIGKFDESFPLDYGDVDLMLRLRNFGYEVLICTAVSGIHHESLTRRTTPIVEVNSKLNLLIKKNQRLPMRDSFLLTCAERLGI
jgi:GT2 family glycosyltransferase